MKAEAFKQAAEAAERETTGSPLHRPTLPSLTLTPLQTLPCKTLTAASRTQTLIRALGIQYPSVLLCALLGYYRFGSNLL